MRIGTYTVGILYKFKKLVKILVIFLYRLVYFWSFSDLHSIALQARIGNSIKNIFSAVILSYVKGKLNA